MSKTFVRFECGQEDRIGDPLGPFEFAQFTYGTIAAQTVDDSEPIHLANYVDGYWVTEDGRQWSDVVIFDSEETAKTAVPREPRPTFLVTRRQQAWEVHKATVEADDAEQARMLAQADNAPDNGANQIAWRQVDFELCDEVEFQVEDA